MNVKFSILIPVYNVESYIEVCISSIYKCNFKDFEVIAVDDGSTDNSGKICDSFSKKYNNFNVIHQKNKGLLNARRVAINKACGKYVLFVDSDDLVETNFLDKINKYIEQCDSDVYFFNYFFLNKKNKIKNTSFNCLKAGYVPKKVIIKMFTTSNNFNNMWIKCIKREKLVSTIDFDSFTKCNAAEDLLQTISIVDISDTFYYIDECLYDYRINRNSITYLNHSKNPENYLKNIIQIHKILYDCSISWCNDLKDDKDFYIKNCYVLFFILLAVYGKKRTKIAYEFFTKDFCNINFIRYVLDNKKMFGIISIKHKITFTLFLKNNHVLLYVFFKFYIILKRMK